ncbi:MAG: choice-of-anchor D domain-containing protein, partial [Ginsengibacter sp.]
MRKISSFKLQKIKYVLKLHIGFLLFSFVLLQPGSGYSQTPSGLITNITTTSENNYTLGELNVGAALYTDRAYKDTSVPLFLKIKRLFKESLRTYQVISIPDFLNSAPFIKTPNDDKASKEVSMLSFDLAESATVYIAYDPRATAIPAWLSSWQKLSSRISINDSKIDYLELYSKNYPAGKVILGGNLATPATGALNNYLVAAVQQASPALIANVTATTGHSYILSKINVDTVIYTDRVYKTTSLPAFLNNAPFIKTPNDDKANNSTSILSFDLTQSATAYVAYDPRATVLPAWLNSWQKLTTKVGINDPKISYLQLYSKNYPAGRVTLDGNLASPAAGALNNYLVIAVAIGQTIQYNLAVTISGNGTVTKNPDQVSYAVGTNVTLTATPASGQQFTGWSGDTSGTTNPLTIPMNSNKSVTATFTPLQYNLTINTSGNGTVTKNPNQASYASGTNVTLTASPAAGQQFTGWSGDASGTTNPLTIPMDGNKSVTAAFAPLQYILTINIVGNGTVTKNPNQASYDTGTNVILTATPSAGQQFTGWSGGVSGTTNPLTIPMDGNKSVTATFAPLQYNLTINIAGNGTVTKNPNQASYAGGTNVILTAAPGAGQQFTGWSGDATGTTNPLTITIDGNKSVTATFASGSTKPIISVTPSTIYDNDVSLGAAGINRIVKVKNIGAGVLSLSAASLAGTNADQFILSGLPSFPANINSGDSISFTVAFNPTSVGLKIASINITSNDSLNPTISVALRGLGTAGLSGTGEPSLQAILNLLEIQVNVGDDAVSTSV